MNGKGVTLDCNLSWLVLGAITKPKEPLSLCTNGQFNSICELDTKRTEPEILTHTFLRYQFQFLRKKATWFVRPKLSPTPTTFFFGPTLRIETETELRRSQIQLKLFCSHSRRGLCWCSVGGSVHRTNFGLGFRRVVLLPNSATCTEKRFELSVGVVSSRLKIQAGLSGKVVKNWIKVKRHWGSSLPLNGMVLLGNTATTPSASPRQGTWLARPDPRPLVESTLHWVPVKTGNTLTMLGMDSSWEEFGNWWSCYPVVDFCLQPLKEGSCFVMSMTVWAKFKQ